MAGGPLALDCISMLPFEHDKKNTQLVVCTSVASEVPFLF